MNAHHTPVVPLLSGLVDPVEDAQCIFRVLLTALSQPGTAQVLPVLPVAPFPLYPATSAILQTLLDFETTLWLQTPTKELSAWLRFHCSVPLVATPESAAFAVIDRPLEMPPLSAFSKGLPEYPDRSAMIILQVNSFEPDGLRLSGPGIENEHCIGIEGLPNGFWRSWRDSQAQAPLGVDLLFVTSDCVLGLPRSTNVETTT
jgi:alpha-D-ribose 1-methylphosphonate 5-triphosphate synthase subunit PhnH